MGFRLRAGGGVMLPTLRFRRRACPRSGSARCARRRIIWVSLVLVFYLTIHPLVLFYSFVVPSSFPLRYPSPSFNCLILVTDTLLDLPPPANGPANRRRRAFVSGRRASTVEASPPMPTVDDLEDERTQ
jgi:hypothetical protein